MGTIAVCHVGGEEAKFPDVVMVPKATQVEPELKFQRSLTDSHLWSGNSARKFQKGVVHINIK